MTARDTITADIVDTLAGYGMVAADYDARDTTARAILTRLDEAGYRIVEQQPELEDKQQIIEALTPVIAKAFQQLVPGLTILEPEWFQAATDVADWIDENLRIDGQQPHIKHPPLEPVVHVGAVTNVAYTAAFGIGTSVSLTFTGRFDIERGQEVHVIAGRTTNEQANAIAAHVARERTAPIDNTDRHIKGIRDRVVIGDVKESGGGVIIAIAHVPRDMPNYPEPGSDMVLTWNDPEPPDDLAVLRELVLAIDTESTRRRALDALDRLEAQR